VSAQPFAKPESEIVGVALFEQDTTLELTIERGGDARRSV